MTVLLLTCLIGFAGGCLGAALGGNLAFGMVAVLSPVCWVVGALTGSTWALDNIAFGPFFGSHVGFAGASAATVYAARRGLIPSGRLVNISLATLRDASVIVVGGIFGTIGVLLASLVDHTPWLASHTDRIAVTVVVSGFLARFVFGDRSVISRERLNDAETWRARIAPTEAHCWLPNQEQPRHYLALGAVMGGAAAVSCLVLGRLAPAVAASSSSVMFGVAGWAAIAVTFGARAWITHHIANVAGLATVLVYARLNPAADRWATLGALGTLPAAGAALLAGFAGGLLAACAAELTARLFLNRSDSYLDPPAMAIASCATLLRGVLG